MELSEGVSKPCIRQKKGRKKSNKPYKGNQCKVKIVHNPSTSNHVRLLKALSILLNEDDILYYFDSQKNLQRKAKKPSKKEGGKGLHHLECMSTLSPIDKYPSKALGSNNEGTK